MYKKTLAAVAILGAFAGSAMAANVTLYGKADLGLNYGYEKIGDANAVNTFKMKSGQYAGSRFGLKGTEDLGNGMTVGFKLENGFDADTGKLGQGSRLFGREAVVYLKGDFGTFAAGRMGDLSSGCGSYSSIWDYAAMGSGWGDHSGAKDDYSILANRTRMDNTLVYVTPDFDGFTVTAQYSFNADDQEKDKTLENDRYAGLGLNYNAGAFAAGLVVDSKMGHSWVADPVAHKEVKDDIGVSLGASFDLDVAKLYAMGQYAKHVGANFDNVKGDKGYSLVFGASAPVLGGTAYTQVNYLDQKPEEKGAVEKHQGYGLAAGYDYALSKRTTVYAFGSYGQLKDKKVEAKDEKTKIGEFGFGLAHSF